MISTFLRLQLALRLYHWNTKIYSRHLASGTLYEKLDPMIDEFVEVASGQNVSIGLSDPVRCDLSRPPKDAEMVVMLKQFALFLKNLRVRSVDLKNLRDSMLSEVNRTLYLFRLH